MHRLSYSIDCSGTGKPSPHFSHPVYCIGAMLRLCCTDRATRSGCPRAERNALRPTLPPLRNDLVAATARGHQKFSLFLLEEGADPNTAGGNGITALHYLVLKGFAVLAAEAAHLGVNSHLYRPSIRRHYFSNWAPVPRSFPSCRQSTEP